jgi:TRAP-type C4-dicarboxylate transport system permease small subunit
MEDNSRRPVGIKRRLWNGLLTLQRVAVAVLGIYVTVMIVLEVVFRYFLNVSIMWVEELTLYLVFWLYFIGASLCTYDRSHIKGGAIQLILRNRPRALLDIEISMVFLSFGLCVLFSVWGFQTFLYSFEVHRRTVQLNLPYAYARLSLVPGFGLMALYFFSEGLDLIKRRKSPLTKAAGGPSE